MLAHNRNNIRDLHDFAECAKLTAKDYLSFGMNQWADKSYSEYAKYTRKIAQLVQIQKALKVEIADTIDFERLMRNFPDAVEAYNLYEIDSHI